MLSISKFVVALAAQTFVGAVALSVSAGTKRKREGSHHMTTRSATRARIAAARVRQFEEERQMETDRDLERELEAERQRQIAAARDTPEWKLINAVLVSNSVAHVEQN